MTYTLHRLAAGSYDLVLDGTVVGSVVRDVSPGDNVQGWRAELLDDRSDAVRPAPFTEAAHEFASLEEVAEWLGGAAFVDKPNND